VLNPRKLIDGMSEMLHRALGETVRVVAALAPDVGNVLADPFEGDLRLRLRAHTS